MSKQGIIVASVIGLVTMGFFSKKPKQPTASKQPWPKTPPKHQEDLHYQMNEYQSFGIYQFPSQLMTNGIVTAIPLWTIVLMENGYGERYANVLRNGVLTTETEVVMNTPDWQLLIKPWLEGRSDHFPAQDGIVAAKISKFILDAEKSIKPSS